MTRIKYDADLMKYISMFESFTRVGVKDCINTESQLIFIVDENGVGKAIGKNGVNARKLTEVLKKQIKIVEFSPDATQFIKNFIYPLQAKEVKSEGSKITIVGPDTNTKGKLIGRDSRNLNNLKDIVQRYFSVDEIRVV